MHTNADYRDASKIIAAFVHLSVGLLSRTLCVLM